MVTSAFVSNLLTALLTATACRAPHLGVVVLRCSPRQLLQDVALGLQLLLVEAHAGQLLACGLQLGLHLAEVGALTLLHVPEL